jgi:hypothetical protein
MDRARLQSLMTQPGAASVVITPGPTPAVTAELQRIAAEQQKAKAELDPAALLARIKFLEWTLSCMNIEGYGTIYGPAFPPPKVYPAEQADVRWMG